MLGVVMKKKLVCEITKEAILDIVEFSDKKHRTKDWKDYCITLGINGNPVKLIVENDGNVLKFYEFDEYYPLDKECVQKLCKRVKKDLGYEGN
jgi:hypothetical protein